MRRCWRRNQCRSSRNPFPQFNQFIVLQSSVLILPLRFQLALVIAVSQCQRVLVPNQMAAEATAEEATQGEIKQVVVIMAGGLGRTPPEGDSPKA